MSDLEQLLEYKSMGYAEWRAHISQMKKKYVHKRNNTPDKEKQAEAERALSAIRSLEELLEKLNPQSENVSLAIRIALSYYENNASDSQFTDLVKACNEKDEDCIKRVYKSGIDEGIKKEWKRTIGKDVIKESKPKESPSQFIDRIRNQSNGNSNYTIIEWVLKGIVLIIPIVFLINLCIFGRMENDHDPSDLFFKPMLIYIIIKYICIAILRFFDKLEGMQKPMIIASVVGAVLSFIPFISNSLKALDGSAKFLYIAYLVAGCVIFYGACVVDKTIIIVLALALLCLLGVRSCEKKYEKKHENETESFIVVRVAKDNSSDYIQVEI